MHQARRSSPLFALGVFIACVLAGVGLFFIPAFIIRPFRYQAPRSLGLAMSIAQHSPSWTLAAAAAALLLTLFLWRRSSLWQRVVLALGIVLVAGAATMARIDYFEWMFHPVASPGFTAASDSKLGDSEMVMAVRLGSENRAYPIREMAYHHVVNDTVAATPIVVTY
jgi:hypothetical protein